MNLRFFLVGCAIVGNGGWLAANSQRPAQAPPARVATTESKKLPSTLVRAKTVFLINEAPGAPDAEFRDLQAQLRKWGRFEIVDRADRADVTMAVTTSEVERPAVQSGAPIGAKFVNPSKNIVRSNVSTLTVRQRSSGEILWSGAGGTAGAALQRLQLQMPSGSRMCVAVWCW